MSVEVHTLREQTATITLTEAANLRGYVGHLRKLEAQRYANTGDEQAFLRKGALTELRAELYRLTKDADGLVDLTRVDIDSSFEQRAQVAIVEHAVSSGIVDSGEVPEYENGGIRADYMEKVAVELPTVSRSE